MVEALETRYARSPDDIHIAYHVFGSGSVDLLTVFGGIASIDSLDDEPSLARFHRRLGSFGRVVRWNPRGIGLSDPTSPWDPPTVEQWVQDAITVLDALGLSRVALFADHIGAIEALLLAATHPTRVSALVIVNGTARAIRDDGYQLGVPQHVMNRVFDVAVEPDAVARGFDGLALFAPTVANDPAFRAWWRRAGNRGASPATARTILQLRYGADVRAALATIRVPTLVLHRRDNHVLRVAHGRYLAEHIAGATFIELPGEDALYWVGDTELMLDEVQEFLTGVRRGADPDRVLASILFTDIVGSTQIIFEVGERKWRDLLDSHDAAVRRQLERFRGREVKTTGDGVLAIFDGPGRALLCACAIRDAAAQLGLQIRAGVHVGETEVRGDDVAGTAVHIGQRVQALAQPGEVLVSATVKDLVAGSSIEFEDRGEHELKGVPGAWRLFCVKT